MEHCKHRVREPCRRTSILFSLLVSLSRRRTEMTKKVCTIVGVGPGLSLAIARRFAREGYQLSLLARRGNALEDYVAQLHQVGGRATTFVADASDDTSLQDALNQSKSQVGVPDVLVYNAAALEPGLPMTLSPATLVNDFKVNVAGALACTLGVVADMRAAGHGTLLFTGGGLALHPASQYASLSIGKAGLRSLTNSLAEELEPDGVHVATVTITGFITPDDAVLTQT